MPKRNIHREGLRFKKLDLHLHTPASKCFADQSVKPEDIVRAAMEKGLDGIAITDHNSGAWIDSVKKAAAGKGLVVFPGVEITCMGGKEGIHVIAFFDPQLGTQDVESLLGNLGLKPSQYGDINTVVQRDPLTIAEIISKRGGLAVLAHSNSTRGCFTGYEGPAKN
jgi:PHP family Zn ribbon phosphoesterase